MEYLIIIFVGAAIAHVVQIFCYFDYLKTSTHDRTPHVGSGMELHGQA
ncbi:hypothetical protein JN12_02407 [Geobacter argillaceus]|uniref:Uncharacterized protein n=1 Tax=Geobacter argillaceus TaxID=345631 RepID=A0A562VLR5_9BACT|nr:hypothetical protein JN12_02407 [Geobacter argillaceus]